MRAGIPVLTTALLLVGAVYPAGAQQRGSGSARPPNVIVILADDMGWADMGHVGSRIDMPSLERLGREGAILQSFYASAPMCSPTRAALLTGRYPHGVGVPELVSPEVRGNVPILALDHAALTIPEALKPRGYVSAIVGKWHLGHAPKDWPRAHGFDAFWGSLIGTPGFYGAKETYENETPIRVEGHLTDRLTEKAVEFIEQRRAAPFFLYLAYNAPHYPLEAPAELVYKYRQRFPDEGLFAVYAAMIEQMDSGIGRVLATLDRLGLAENTLVLFTSDNGPSAENRSYGPAGARISSHPFREHKFSMLEGGIRVPFVARWPARIPAGGFRDEPAITMDLMPTVLEATGTRAPAGHEMHGVSILPLLTGGRFERPGALHWENQDNHAVRMGRWKLVHQYWNERPVLYNLADDPTEQRDVSARFPDVTKELEEAHRQWRERHYPRPVARRTSRPNGLFPRR